MKYLGVLISALLSGHVCCADWYFVGGEDVYVLRKRTLLEIEDKLWRYIRDAEIDMQPRGDYRYQYQFHPEGGYVYILGVCDDGKKLHDLKGFLQVSGGGSCYFQSEYELIPKLISRFQINAPK